MKLMIAFGVTPESPDPPRSVQPLIDAATDIHVMSPSLVSPLQWLTGEVDQARRTADERLSTVLGALESADATITTGRGEELLRTAFDDAIKNFGPDHLIVVIAGGDSLWRRHHVLDHLVDNYQLPLTVVTA